MKRDGGQRALAHGLPGLTSLGESLSLQNRRGRARSSSQSGEPDGTDFFVPSRYPVIVERKVSTLVRIGRPSVAKASARQAPLEAVDVLDAIPIAQTVAELVPRQDEIVRVVGQVLDRRTRYYFPAWNPAPAHVVQRYSEPEASDRRIDVFV